MKMFAAGLLVFVGAQQTLPTELGVSQLEPTRIGLAAQEPAQQQQLPAQQLEERPQSQLPGALFSFQLRDSPLIAVLNSIAQQAGLNLIAPPDLTGAPVTIDLQNVTLQQALDAIILPRGLQYRIEDGMLRVEPVQAETRIFKFDYITTTRTLSRSLSASSTTGGGGGVSALSGAGAGAGAAAAGGGGGGGGSSASLTGQDSTNLLQDVEGALKLLISPNGKFTFNRMAGLIFVTDFPRFLDTVQLYLETIQNAVHRQVVIEAKVIEVKLNDNSQFGVNWTALLGNAVRMEQALPSSGNINIGVTIGDFNAVISALRTQGNVNVLSSPSIATLNSQPAIMRVGTQDVFFTTTTQVDPRTGSIVQTSVVPQTIHAGIVLDVTPQISDDGVIIMNVHPTITERTGQVTGPQGITVPIVDVRETDTVVRVREGGTVLIGGLISDRQIVNRDKVPVLGDIPFVGNIFSRNSKETRKTDLVILLTPKVLNLQTAVDFTRSRIENQERLKTEKR